MGSGSSILAITFKRPPQRAHCSISHEGQKPRRLQLNATSFFSARQSSQRTRKKPCSRRPHFRYTSNSFCTYLGSDRPAASRPRGERGVVPLDELVEQRRLGPVARVARRIDERWRTRACPLARHGFASLTCGRNEPTRPYPAAAVANLSESTTFTIEDGADVLVRGVTPDGAAVLVEALKDLFHQGYVRRSGWRELA